MLFMSTAVFVRSGATSLCKNSIPCGYHQQCRHLSLMVLHHIVVPHLIIFLPAVPDIVACGRFAMLHPRNLADDVVEVLYRCAFCVANGDRAFLRHSDGRDLCASWRANGERDFSRGLLQRSVGTRVLLMRRGCTNTRVLRTLCEKVLVVPRRGLTDSAVHISEFEDVLPIKSNYRFIIGD